MNEGQAVRPGSPAFCFAMTARIAIDCMGGDHGPSVTVPASLRFLEAHPAASLILVGREESLQPLLGKSAASSRLRVVHGLLIP